ncbi:MAG: hypothetical protein GAK29_04697 [Acinetobacter bereziniae]|uniref:Uncharacterized protein n=1 Tax=Acinetobacter bereziniae TaxID=106648 RepID=A0A833P8Z2_ACIBZ|nr:MAG: hypothetical protein GAK29_04697 [Acinetobacter bereziniae]
MIKVNSFFEHGDDNELLLGVGVNVGLITLSLELLFGEILAGKLRVLVHWTRLRTIFEKLKLNTFQTEHRDVRLLFTHL